ncbi:tetraprenyl-beta-curcumene synthase family protein [Anaerobacillus isosaccharinicus]|uniref:Tetraprenyl-beta-curcumene synthase n=1 Tax=Anaerobacillus isosaccharinicus TaxID=1532552 RepID=A0A1S2KTM9_9BACI|nr:tetraprenyl-beta-curcumene synthase family protein [Anaerobacillus isosaccharinicus]MBA5588089.1 tetraprenyl-beta-curcumene synthase family protein [Anaerobacillus isosaccharinicus]QOY33773.1 tetraprenyl-beta-curcumene synthase family protein [Anaerobacillus isosaccharinicus]
MSIPKQPWTMMAKIYKHVLPRVHKNLDMWKQKADAIPNNELRKQALASIESKTFHCEGGSIYGLLAKDRIDDVIRFIVAYQTISDYLDNLCDRSTSLDPTDFQALHHSMVHALTPDAPLENYYRYRDEQDDGGYLRDLVKTCQDIVSSLPNYSNIFELNLELAQYYCDLQVHKHVKKEERVPRLEEWFNQYKDKLPPMSWYEFSACSGSTLGIFCLVSYATNESFTRDDAKKVKESYFPWVQGLHIMLDYFIDQEEDRQGGDLNFCFYYDDEGHLIERLECFAREADKSIRKMPNQPFHSFINKGLLAIYLADEKVRKQKKVRELAKRLIRIGGGSTLFFYVNGWIYRRLN